MSDPIIFLTRALNEGTAPSNEAIIEATPFLWRDPKTIKPRDWLYANLLQRQHVSVSLALGGTGKTSQIIAETLAMVSGKPLLGITPPRRLRCWLWNLEDPREEIDRRIAAAMLYYGLTAEDIEGYLFVNHGRDTPLVITESTGSNTTILRPVVDALVSEVCERGIDVLTIDPFISSHDAQENNNPAMDKVIKEWGCVADKGNCAGHVVHHTRKGEQEVTTESGRGAKALTDAGRIVRVFNRMTKEEGDRAGITELNHRRYYRTYIDKQNMAPPAERSEWFYLASVDLKNGPLPGGAGGDSVGVSTPWKWPDPLEGVTGRDFECAAALIRGGRWRASAQARDWVGKAVAQALKVDVDCPKGKAKVLGIIKLWIKHGSLLVVEGQDSTRHTVKWVEVAEHD
jgi:hypothetical protein